MSSSDSDDTTNTRVSTRSSGQTERSTKTKTNQSRRKSKKKTKKKSLGPKKATNFIDGPQQLEPTLTEASLPVAVSPATATQGGYKLTPTDTEENLIVAEANADVESNVDPEEPESRAARRARGKSVYLTCFAGFDSIYFILRLVVFLRVDIFHDAWQDKIKILANTNASGSVSEIEADSSGKYFCGDEALEAQCAWIFSLTWLFYFLANASLILSIIWLSLKLCYAYIFLKTTSVIINFLGIFTFGSHCLSQKFYVETGVFFIIHLPLQIFGTKRTRNYALSLKRAEMEKVARVIKSNTDQITTSEYDAIQKRRSIMALQRRKSYQVVTTVDN